MFERGAASVGRGTVNGNDDGDSGILSRLDGIQGSLTTLETELANENELRGKRIATTERNSRWLALAVAVALIVGMIGIYNGIQGRHTAHAARQAAEQAKAALHEAQVNTTEARKSACLNANVSQRQARTAAQLQINYLVYFTKNPTPAQQAQIQVFLHGTDGKSGYYKTIDDGLPFRDCSPAGIAAFYATASRGP